MQKILISSCLLGNKVRYDGQAKPIAHPQISTWLAEQRLVVICPEVAGGLPTPRARAERLGDKVIDEFNNDVTKQFQLGANQALQLCQQQEIKFALLKEFSPSCGSVTIYDGQFNGKKHSGMGITSQLLTANGVQVFSELNIDELAAKIQSNNKNIKNRQGKTC